MSVVRRSHRLIKNASSCILFNSRRVLGTSSARLEVKKEEWTTRKEKSVLPKEEWRSFFHYFAPEKGITIDVVHALQKPVNLSPKAIHNWYKRWKNSKMIFDQSYLEERVAAVGCELAAGHFIVYRGGKVRAKGSSNWIAMDEDDNYDLPKHYTPGFFMEAIDASGMNLVYEGLECLSNLEYLQWLNLADCTHMDDWCMDRICGQYQSTLKYLNISNCTGITGRGIATLGRLRELKTLDLTGLHNIQDIELLCLLLEDINPSLEIIGINYMESPKLEDKMF